MKKNGTKIKIIVFLVLIAAVIWANHRFGLASKISSGEFTSYMKNMIKEHLILSVLIYIGITIVGCVLLALPGATFAILSGLLFGPITGSLACLIATTLGAMFAFLVGRFFLKDAVKPMLSKSKLLSKLLFSNNKNSDIVLLMITRMIPIFPYNLQNFAYGVTDIGFATYSVYTFLFMMPGVAFFTIGAAGANAGENKWIYFLVAGVLAVGATVAGLLLHRKYVKSEKEESVVEENVF
jgi:uncharacterized membrane protein YdjX (TVP38/TMEM64 family)